LEPLENSNGPLGETFTDWEGRSWGARGGAGYLVRGGFFQKKGGSRVLVIRGGGKAVKKNGKTLLGGKKGGGTWKKTEKEVPEKCREKVCPKKKKGERRFSRKGTRGSTKREKKDLQRENKKNWDVGVPKRKKTSEGGNLGGVYSIDQKKKKPFKEGGGLQALLRRGGGGQGKRGLFGRRT